MPATPPPAASTPIAPSTRIAQVMAEVRARIHGRALAPGARLPSVRAQARAMDVSVSTVVEAYERLAAEGVIRARPGSGFYVCGPAAPLVLAQMAPRVEREVDPLWISRQALEAGGDMLKPGCGWLPPDWLPQAALRAGLRRLARAEGAELTDYATPLGHPPLRALLSRRLADCGVLAEPGRILLTDGGTEAIDLVARLLLQPGDTVLVDDPCYFNFRALMKAHRTEVIGVPYTPDGPDLAAFEAALATHAPRLYITNAALHNPTGAVLAPAVAHRVLRLAERAGLTIVEDDIFADFEHVPAPRLAAFDGLERVIAIGSFSKTLSAAARCGYVAGRPEMIEALTDLKIATRFGGGRLDAGLVHEVLTDSGTRRHLEALRTRLAAAMAETERRLARLGIVPWLRPRAGMFLWCRLPEGVEAAPLARACLAQGVVLAPGNAFSPSPEAGRFLRMNVAQSGDPRIFTALAQAMDSLRPG